MSAIALAAASTEEALRARLGIPADADRVIFFAESSHWDPNWLLTSEEYYERRIQHILDAVLAELAREPGRVFSIESLFFLRMYWQRRPERRATLRELVNDGRLRLTGTGLTSPDTLLPSTESILRDFLIGQEWLRQEGMTAEPRLAYFADDFGHSPALPSLLAALGYTQAAITRIDGGYFVGADYRPGSAFPLPGSSAELLTRTHRSADFVWRALDGAEVLCHWNPHTYFQGDMLASVGVIRWMGRTFGLGWRTRGHVARRIRRYVAQLAPLARTPYVFCPIGCDFNGPIHGLAGLLARFNAGHFGETGVWAVLAGLDDYLDLVDCGRENLPVIALDPNPAWMGFYSSRPEVKQRSNRLAHRLEVIEKVAAAAPPRAEGAAALRRDLDAAWDLVALSNHHDFVTGTSPDRVWHEEQRPWLARAEALAERASGRVLSPPSTPEPTSAPDSTQVRTSPPSPEPTSAPAAIRVRSSSSPQGSSVPAWSLDRGLLRVHGNDYELALDERQGGCLTSLVTGAAGELLAGPAGDLVAYHDTGGLWRLGHEYLGGSFREVERSSRSPARIDARSVDGALVVRIDSVLDGRPFERWLWLRADSPLVRLRVVGAARSQRTITCRFPTVLRAEALAMDVPGGLVERPRRKLYDPTFWPARSFVHVRDDAAARGLAAFLGGPATASLDSRGALEWVVLRNAAREKAFGLLPVLAHPARGVDAEEHAFDGAVWPTAGHGEQGLPARARQVLSHAWLDPGLRRAAEAADRVLTCDRADVVLTAAKRAHRGPGLVVRLERHSPEPIVARLRHAHLAVRSAWLCDARERDLGPLGIDDGVAIVPLQRGITSVRVMLAGGWG